MTARFCLFCGAPLDPSRYKTAKYCSSEHARQARLEQWAERRQQAPRTARRPKQKIVVRDIHDLTALMQAHGEQAPLPNDDMGKIGEILSQARMRWRFAVSGEMAEVARRHRLEYMKAYLRPRRRIGGEDYEKTLARSAAYREENREALRTKDAARYNKHWAEILTRRREARRQNALNSLFQTVETAKKRADVHEQDHDSKRLGALDNEQFRAPRRTWPRYRYDRAINRLPSGLLGGTRKKRRGPF